MDWSTAASGLLGRRSPAKLACSVSTMHVTVSALLYKHFEAPPVQPRWLPASAHSILLPPTPTCTAREILHLLPIRSGSPSEYSAGRSLKRTAIPCISAVPCRRRSPPPRQEDVPETGGSAGKLITSARVPVPLMAVDGNPPPAGAFSVQGAQRLWQR